PVISPQTLVEIQDHVRKVYASTALLDYLQDLLDASRQRHSTGLSPRAGLALLHASQAWALMHGRDMVLPEDIQAVGIAVMAHRLGHDIEQPGRSGRTLADNLLHSVPVPWKQQKFQSSIRPPVLHGFRVFVLLVGMRPRV